MITPKSIIVVAGMHRSGTSATTGVLQALGVHLPGQLMDGNEFNSKGYFENERIVQFHDELLRRLDSTHDEPLALTQLELDRARAEGVVDDLTRILLEETNDHALCAYKDPRSCRLLPLWSEAIQAVSAEMLVVFPLRDPIEVAASLSRRDGLSQAHGLILWLNHALAAELNSRGHQRSFFLYASLLENWRTVTAKVARDLGLRYPKDRHDAGAEIDDFLSTELRHHCGGIEHTDENDLQRTVKEAWRAFTDLCEDRDNEKAKETLDAIRQQMQASEMVFRGFVRANRHQREKTSERNTALEEHAAHMDQRLRGKDARILELDARTGAAEGQSQTLTVELDGALSRFATLRSEHDRTLGRLGRTQRTLRLVNRNLDAAQRELTFSRHAKYTNDRDLASTIQTAARLRLAVDGHLRDADEARGEAETARLQADEARRDADAMRAHAQAVEEHRTMLLRSNAWQIARYSAAVMRRVPAPVRALMKRALRPLRNLVLPGPAKPSAPMTTPPQQCALPAEIAVADEVMEMAPSAPPSDLPLGRVASDAELQTAAIIEDSVFFDAQTYNGAQEAEALGLTPALHYVLIGEAKGYSPSQKFDPHFYGLMYRDIEEAGINKLEHYITNGASEGRCPLYPADKLYLPKFEPDTQKPTALLIAHEASRTGAPILAWNIVHHLKATHNVLTLLLGPGDLTANFVEISDGVVGPLATEVGHNPIEAKYIVGRILKEYSIDFVVANSIETRIFAVEFAKRMVPLVTLSHEFASYTRPVGALEEIFSVSDEVVFSAELVKKQSKMDYPILAVRDVHVIPQGQSVVPLTSNLDDEELEATPHDEDLRPADAPDTFLVVGLGTVQHRKGVDLFISAAATAMRARPDLNFRFVWYGHGYRPDIDAQYSAYLKAQIEILGLSGRLEIRDPIMNLSSVYRQADALLLSSRLDPLPNVAIDAAMAEIPVVCFEGASGFADILASDHATAELVVPHLDSTAAGHLLADLAGDRSRWLNLRQAIGHLGERTFRMEEYVATLAALGERAAERNRLKKIDREFLRDSNVFESNFYKGFSLTHMSDDDALTHYLTHASRVGALSNPDIDLQTRTPLPGFHPLSFAREGLNYERTLERDPLAEFLRMGSPNGPWLHSVITATGARPTPFRSQLTAVHGHFHYPELVPEFLSALSRNQLECDLFFSVTQPAAVEAVKAATDRYDRGDVQVRVVPNLGRDIGPFLTEFASELSAYEIIGHFHGKRSVHLENRAKDHGTRWRNFLWQHLLGDEHEMADIIVDRMIGDPKLGLVFAEDTYLLGWTENRKIAERLAGRLGMASHLPDFFSFPMGTMFWARQEALQPLFDLDLTWNDYPAEPLANDGTILHAIERLIPHVVAKQGYSAATTHLPGVAR